MAKVECQFMEVGKPLFLAGTNYGEKLYPKSGKGKLTIIWDEEQRRAEIRSDKGFTFVTEPWVFCWEPVQTEKRQVENKHFDHTIAPVKAQIGGPNDVHRTAQVETPIDKVQGAPRKGRAPKFQGESDNQGE